MKVCFLTKEEKLGVQETCVDEAIVFTENIIEDIDIFYGNSAIPFPEKAKNEYYEFNGLFLCVLSL